MNQKTVETLSYVKSSKHRQNIICFIGEDIKVPTEIAKNIKISSKHISKYLSDLKERDVVVCLNENAKKGRLYKLTPLGKVILKFLS